MKYEMSEMRRSNLNNSSPEPSSSDTSIKSDRTNLSREEMKKQVDNASRELSIHQYLSHNEVILPIFEENVTNPVYHLKQLDEYMQMRNIPESIKLTVAYRSLKGEGCKIWIETMNSQIHDYNMFKREMLRNWWFPSEQNNVRCKIDQDRYEHQSHLSLSAYFMKYVTLASYLDVKFSEDELVEALLPHFPFYIQKAMINTPAKTVTGVLDMIKKLKLLIPGNKSTGMKTNMEIHPNTAEMIEISQIPEVEYKDISKETTNQLMKDEIIEMNPESPTKRIRETKLRRYRRPDVFWKH
jgi:hypothetical protein